MVKPIRESTSIAVPPAAVWQLISAPSHLVQCHPFCASNPVERWPGRGSIDHIIYYNGRTIERRFVNWLELVGYDIEISDSNGRVADVVWRLSAGNSGSKLSISITPRFLGDRNAAVRAILNSAFVRPTLRRYLRSVLAGVEYRATTGKTVTRNQFGPHRLFSSAK